MAGRRFRFIAVEGAGGTEGAFVPIEPRRVLSARRALFPGRSLATQLQLLYMTVLSLGIITILFWGMWGTVGSNLEELAGPYHLIWGSPAILLLTLAALRYNTLQGFVSFSEPDCAHLLTAPVPRRGLTWPRLRNTSTVLACSGAIAGVLAGLASGEPVTGASRGWGLGEDSAAGFALGLILVAAGWQVQRSVRISRWVVKLTLPALALVVLAAVAGDRGGAPNAIALWSGPWGWALLPAVGRAPWQGVVGLALLWSAAIAGLVGTVMSAGRASLEGFQRRAHTRSRVVAGLYSFDARSVLRATREPRSALSCWRVRIRVPRTPSLALAWRGLLSLIRSPLRLGWGVALGGAGALLFTIGKGSSGMSWGGALLLYLAASALIEPLRTETDSPASSHLLLPWSYGRVLWLHCLLPAAILVGAGIVAAAGAFAAGRVTGQTLFIFVILWVPAASAAVFAAALSARGGGRVSSDLLLMTSGDSTGLSMLLMLARVLGWTIAAIVVVALGVGRIVESGSITAGLVGALGFVLAALLLRSSLLATKTGAT